MVLNIVQRWHNPYTTWRRRKGKKKRMSEKTQSNHHPRQPKIIHPSNTIQDSCEIVEVFGLRIDIIKGW